MEGLQELEGGSGGKDRAAGTWTGSWEMRQRKMEMVSRAQ